MSTFDRLAPEELSKVTTLSPREAEVLQATKLYKGDDERVAEEMDVAEATVRSMRSKARRKADEAKTTVEAVKEYDESWAETVEWRDEYTPISERE